MISSLFRDMPLTRAFRRLIQRSAIEYSLTCSESSTPFNRKYSGVLRPFTFKNPPLFVKHLKSRDVREPSEPGRCPPIPCCAQALQAQLQQATPAYNKTFSLRTL
mmetsp:Transcript_7138/g.21774  ORF Transcript_7138/g.21774 Transcript_7138/m.21774 type:complete len:105 (+) Transcript_7138:1372-1686(+)